MRQTTLFIIILGLTLVLLLSGCKKGLESGNKNLSDPDDSSGGKTGDNTADETRDGSEESNPPDEEISDAIDDDLEDINDENENSTDDDTEDINDEDEDSSDDASTITLTKIDCTKRVAIGILSSEFCKVQEDGSLQISLRNSGFVNISGVHFELMDKQKEILHSFDSLFDFQKGAENMFTIPAQDYSNLSRIEISPIDESSICQNRQLLVLPENSCE